MDIEYVLIVDIFDRREPGKSFGKPTGERGMFEPTNDREILLFFEVAEVAFRFEIAERIERHFLDSLR